MRVFNFKARNIGEEKYLTYTMGEECELDEDVLDYCEDNNLKELVDIIYEEDDDYDYLTYDITGKVSLEEYIANEMKAKQVLLIVRNLANNLISFKEQAIQLSYILLNRSYIFVGDDMELQYICLPVESKAAVAAEFKSFVRQLLANMKYDVEEELSYVGKLLTYINSDSFNLRGMVGLAQALMEEAGIGFEDTSSIDADGVEVVNDEPVLNEGSQSTADFMSGMDDAGDLPEIGDDEEDEAEEEAESADDEELDSILPAGMNAVKEEEIEIPTIGDVEVSDSEASDDEASDSESVETVEATAEVTPAETEKAENEEKPAENTEEPKVTPVAQPAPQETAPAQKSKETDVDIIKSRIKELVNTVPTLRQQEEPIGEIKTLADLDNALGSNRPPVIKKNVVKVNRAALIQSAAEHEGETEKLEGPGPVEAELTPATPAPVAEPVVEEEKPKSNSILSKTVAAVVEAPRASIFNAPKAMPYLIRVNTEERIMLGKVMFKIGKASRGVDYTVDGNGAISRQHAVIIQRDGVCYIKDNKSTNHTYVNDKMVEDGVEEILTHDSRIRLGDEEFLFKIR
ncbi:MAG: FHA domain-containing protein [Lachnospiraceae bacterium]|nr:FHA domain-containing protein [Lachnospiraceae bacterium]